MFDTFLSRHVEPAGDGTLNMLGGGVDLQVAPALPFLFPILYVTAKVEFDVEEGCRPHVFRLRLFNPAAEQVLESEPIDMDSQAPFPPDRDRVHANIVLALQNLLLTSEGVYRFQLFCDGAIARETRLRLQVQAAHVPPPEVVAVGGLD